MPVFYIFLDVYKRQVYYYENGKKVTGWHTLKSYYDKKKYKFYFNKNGVLVKDLFTLNYKKWIKKDITIVVNTKTHNATLYAKDKKTGKYNIPLKTIDVYKRQTIRWHRQAKCIADGVINVF